MRRRRPGKPRPDVPNSPGAHVGSVARVVLEAELELVEIADQATLHPEHVKQVVEAIRRYGRSQRGRAACYTPAIFSGTAFRAQPDLHILLKNSQPPTSRGSQR